MNLSDYYERAHWLDCKITEIIEVTECEPEVAEQIAREFMDTNRIPFHYTLYFETYGYVTAAQVLSNPEKYDQRSICDPFRINHTEGHDEAVFHWNNGNPMVHSRADSGTKYRFAFK